MTITNVGDEMKINGEYLDSYGVERMVLRLTNELSTRSPIEADFEFQSDCGFDVEDSDELYEAVLDNFNLPECVDNEGELRELCHEGTPSSVAQYIWDNLEQ